MNRSSHESDVCGVRVVDGDRVRMVRDAMPDEELVAEVADIFALLGDPNRLRLLVALLEGGEMCVCDLAASTGMSESATSHALRWLRAHRIVSAPRRAGRMAYYRLADSHVRMLLDVTLSHTQHTSAMHPERTIVAERKASLGAGTDSDARLDTQAGLSTARVTGSREPNSALGNQYLRRHD